MKPFTYRRIRNSSLTLVVLALLWMWVRAQENALQSTPFTTGYLMLSAITVLALYNIRKKLPFLPLGSSTNWLQWHLYIGMGSVGVFALHVGPHWPSGVLDGALTVAYALTIGSGIVGLYLTRTIPAQLARVGDELIYERIPAYRRQVCRQAGAVVLESVAASGATTLADFYVRRLFDFFECPRGVRYAFRPTSARRRALMSEMTDLGRFFTDQERLACERLFALVRRKDDLDFHEARQKLLKMWLFAHIALTYALATLAVLHGILAHAFSGGAA